MNPKSLRLLPLLLPFLWVGCGTTQPVTERPFDWAAQLQEKVQPIASQDRKVQAQLAAPNSMEVEDGRWAYGTPRNLTDRVSPFSSREQKHASANQAGVQSGSIQQDVSPANIVFNVNANTGDTLRNPEPQNLPEGNQSMLEGLYRGGYEKEANRELKQFGYDFFAARMDHPEPQGAVPDHYVVGRGDEVEIIISGSFDAYYALKIDRSGSITVPDIGPIAIAGKRFDELEPSIRAFIQDRRSGFELSVSMGKLRTIQVAVVGRVNNPGAVEVTALADVVSVLSKAGGPSKDGTLRKILLWRYQKETIEIDLYSLFQGGDQSARMLQFQDGDTLCVPAIGATVGVAGYVQQPGIYELSSDSVTINEALDLAGGLTPFSFTPQAHLEKTVDGRGREKMDVSLKNEGDTLLMKSGELLLVEAVEADRQTLVRIEGEVARAGDYQYRPGMTLRELIERADGLTVDAYLPQVLISRQIGQTGVIEPVTDRVGLQTSRKVIVSNLEAAMAGDPKHDVVLMPLDLVTVRSQDAAQSKATVEIIGAVQRPGVYELTAGMRVSDLVAIAGNPTADVFYDEAELIRKYFDEEDRRLDVKRFRFDLKAALSLQNDQAETHNASLENGDRLVIRALQEAQVRVRIEGQVRFPGEYVFPSGAKITELLSAAGGLLKDADLRAASFQRESTRERQSSRLDHLNERTRRLNEGAFERLVQTGAANEGLAAKIALEQTMNTMGRIKVQQADGRIVIPFDRSDFPQSPFNLELQDGDKLSVPRYEATVSVAGHVFRPVSLVAAEPISVKDAIEQAGGLTEFGDKNLVYVLRADGRVDSVAQKPSRLNEKTTLLAGDVLLVPRKAMERTVSAQVSDVLGLLRELAEVGVIGSQLGNEIDMTLVRSIYDRSSSVDSGTLTEGL